LGGFSEERFEVATYYLQFESRPLPGQDDAYNRWYSGVHVPDVLRVPGFKRLAGRYRIIADEPEPRYLALYEIESEDPQATLTTLFASAEKMVISPALDRENVQVRIMESCQP
jgi:hypothetical protein